MQEMHESEQADRGERTTLFRVLIVCRANICRSPTAELLLRRGLATNSMAHLVRVFSAGVIVVPGLPWCEAAASKVSKAPDRTMMLENHRAREVNAERIHDADLILTAARQQRAAVVRMVPTAGVRTFTLREAAVLAGAVAAGLADPAYDAGREDGAWWANFTVSPLPRGVAPKACLQWLTSEMHNARGLVSMPPRKDGVEGIDIPDAHGPERARHNVDQILSAVQTWADAARFTLDRSRIHDVISGA